VTCARQRTRLPRGGGERVERGRFHLDPEQPHGASRIDRPFGLPKRGITHGSRRIVRRPV
jgi:hypothetical protein